jgi:hypothetical protein
MSHIPNTTLPACVPAQFNHGRKKFNLDKALSHASEKQRRNKRQSILPLRYLICQQ